MAQMKTVALIAAHERALQEQMQTILDDIAATLTGVRVALDLLDVKISSLRADVNRLKHVEGETPAVNG